MNTMARPAAALIAIAVALSIQPAAAKPVVKTDTYVGAFDPLTFGICKAEGAPENIGKVCFKIPKKKKKQATMTINDTLGDALGGGSALFFMFVDRAGSCVGQPDDPTAACPHADFACPSKKWPIPRKAVGLEIYPLTVLGPSVCVLEGADGFTPASTGTVTVRFA